MLGKVLEASVRLNCYISQQGHTKSISIDAWGFSELTGRKCLVVRDSRSQVVHVIGITLRRSQIAAEDLPLMKRARVVEESVTSSGRSEWTFYIEDVDEKTAHAVLRSAIIEPGAVVGGGVRL
jgi:hypothetical protein